MALNRLLILPALAILALAGNPSPASADAQACACAAEIPLEPQDFCYEAPGPQIADFAYNFPSEFFQVVGYGSSLGYCRRNSSFTWLDGPGTLACEEFIGCLCANPSPGIEITCNDNDDDCDPATSDEASGPCEADAMGICAQGEFVCGASGEVCEPGLPEPTEVCGNVEDEDCDGDVDDLDVCQTCFVGQACATGVQGICATGEYACPSGVLGDPVCGQTTFPETEVCDDLDNDCDGAVDEEGVCACPCEAEFATSFSNFPAASTLTGLSYCRDDFTTGLHIAINGAFIDIAVVDPPPGTPPSVNFTQCALLDSIGPAPSFQVKHINPAEVEACRQQIRASVPWAVMHFTPFPPNPSVFICDE